MQVLRRLCSAHVLVSLVLGTLLLAGMSACRRHESVGGAKSDQDMKAVPSCVRSGISTAEWTEVIASVAPVRLLLPPGSVALEGSKPEIWKTRGGTVSVQPKSSSADWLSGLDSSESVKSWCRDSLGGVIVLVQRRQSSGSFGKGVYITAIPIVESGADFSIVAFTGDVAYADTLLSVVQTARPVSRRVP